MAPGRRSSEAKSSGLYSGDRKIADLLGLEEHTVARGRRKLFRGDVERDRVRREGGGRQATEKKRRTSPRRSGD